MDAWLKYLDASSIHGLIYLNHRSSSKYAIIFWSCSLLSSAAIFFLLIFKTTEKFLANRTVTRFADKEISIEDIPFPAVTICSDSLIYKTISDSGNISKSSTDDDLNAYQLFDLLHDQHFTESANLSHRMHNILPVLQKYFMDDGFLSSTATFRSIQGVPFSTLLTKWGLCLNFNLQPMKKLLHIDKYLKRVSSDFFYEPPAWFKAYRSGSKNITLPWKTKSKFVGLHINGISTNSKNDYQHFIGSRVIIHNTDEFPFRTGQHLRQQANEIFHIGYTPTLTVIDDKLKSLHPQKRSCFMEDEKQLKYFKIYTRTNCEHECLSDAILQGCGCVPFYMIRSPSNRICGVVDRHCYSMLETKFDFSSCNCFERCDKLSYLIDIYHFRKTRGTRFWLYPHATFFRPSIRYFAFGVSDFLAEFGGLMGLLAGISVFSVIELVVAITKCIRFAVCKRKVAPETVLRPWRRKSYLVDKEHLLYHLGKTFMEFLKESNVHGLPYISNKDLKVFERVGWFIAICVLMAVCSFFVADSVDDLQSNAVIVALDEKIWSVEDIPFPVISLCPDLDYEMMHRHVQCVDFETCDEVGQQAVLRILPTIRAGFQICDPQVASNIDNHLYYELLQNENKNMSFADHLEHYLNQKWPEENSFCMDGEPAVGPTEAHVVDSFGLCFILNSKEKIYSESVFQRVSGSYTAKCKHSSRIKNGMTIELSGKKPKFFQEGDTDAILPLVCLSDLGMLLVHSREQFIRVPAARGNHKEAFFVVVTPKITSSDESLRNFHPTERNCYFDDERKLKYFNKYTKGDCLDECHSDQYYEMCHCVPYSFPRSYKQKICLNTNEACMDSVESILIDETSEAFKNCDCLPDCNIVEYTFKQIDARMASENVTKYIEVNGSIAMESLVSIYFGGDQYTAFKRYASYGTVSLLSDIGGFLGLFLGISLFSFIETIYFFSLRFFNNLWL